MLRWKKFFMSVAAFLLCIFISSQAAFAGSYITLKKEMRGEMVSALQKDLKTLGFMDIEPTGYFGDITEAAVLEFQKKYGLLEDGIAGKQTLGKIDSLLKRETTVYRGGTVYIGQKIVEYAKRFLGVRYRWGGSSAKGFDCSGFVRYVFKKYGVNLNRVSRAQAQNGVHVKKAALLPGDLVFFDTNGGHNRINHVGIYIGGGKMIHSSSFHSGVIISSITSGIYSKTYMTARRVLNH